mgnify:CR=1 FL=1
MNIGVRICYSRTFCIYQFYKNIKRILFHQTMLSHEYFRDLSEIIVQRYLLCLIDYKVKALLGYQNLHAYG